MEVVSALAISAFGIWLFSESIGAMSGRKKVWYFHSKLCLQNDDKWMQHPIEFPLLYFHLNDKFLFVLRWYWVYLYHLQMLTLNHLIFTNIRHKIINEAEIYTKPFWSISISPSKLDWSGAFKVTLTVVPSHKFVKVDIVIL